MARRHRKLFCIYCGGHRDVVGGMSQRGRCQGCAERRILENGHQLAEHSGPFFDHWLERCRAAFGVTNNADTQPGR